MVHKLAMVMDLWMVLSPNTVDFYKVCVGASTVEPIAQPRHHIGAPLEVLLGLPFPPFRPTKTPNFKGSTFVKVNSNPKHHVFVLDAVACFWFRPPPALASFPLSNILKPSRTL